MIARASISTTAASASITEGFFATERPSRTRYLPGFAAAIAVHALILFAWRQPAMAPMEQVEFGVEFAESSVEVSLVAALPAEEIVEVPEMEVEPEPPVIPEPPAPEPIPEPPPVVETPPEMTVPIPEPAPEAAPVAPPEPVQAKPEPPKAQPKPKPKVARTRRAVGDGSSAIPGKDATTAVASTGAASAKPGYLRNPHPAYPEQCRKLGQQGVVTLRVSVDAKGRPTSVSLTRSSGYPLLDERARSTVAGRWMFKPARVGGQPIASQIIVPVRFTLAR